MAARARESDVSSTTSGLTGEWEHEKSCIVCSTRVAKTGLGSNKRYGCKFCNHAVCSKCSPSRDLHPDTGKSERICNNCYRSKDGQEAKTQMAETIAQASSEIARLETQLQETTQAKQMEEVMRVRKERECEELKGRVFALSCELSAEQGVAVELEKVKGELGKAKERAETVEKANEALKADIDHKKTELIDYLTELKATNSKLVDQRELQVQLQSAQESLQKATSQAVDLQHSNSALETATVALKEQLQLSQTLASEARVRGQALEAQVKELESARAALQGQLASRGQENSSFQSELTEALRRAKEAEVQLEEWTSAKRRADKERVQEERLVTSKIAALQQTVTDFTTAAEEQRQACLRKDALIESLEQQVEEARTTLKSASEAESTQLIQLRVRLQETEVRCTALAKAKDDLSLTYNQTSIALKMLQTEASALTTDRDFLRSQLQSLQLDLKTSQSSLEDWRQRCSSAQQETAVLSDKLAVSASALEDSQTLVQSERLRHLSEEKELKRTYLEELESNRRTLELQIRSLTAETQVLKDKIATLNSSLDTLSGVKARQELELTACQERLRTLEEVQIGLERRSNESAARHKGEMETSALQLESLREDKLRLTAELAQKAMVLARAEERSKELTEERDRLGKELEDLRYALNRGENEQIRTLASENKELNQALKQAMEQKHSVEAQLLAYKSLQTQLDSTQARLTHTLTDLDRTKALAQEREIEGIRLTQDLTASRDHANRLNAHLSDLQKALEAKEAEYTAKVRKMSEGGSAEVSRLEEQVQTYRLQSVSLEEELHKAKLDNARKAHDLEAANADLLAQLSTTKTAIAGLQKDLTQQKDTYDRDKATAVELIDSLNQRLKTQSADLRVLEQERTRLHGLLDSTQQSNEELTHHLTLERVSSIKKDKELQRKREVVEDVEDLAVLKTEQQDAAVRRLTAARSATKTMGERELEEQGMGRKRRGSDPTARDACRCAVF